MIRRLILDHPASVGETYWQHMAVAASFGWAMAKASAACFVHALVPGLCERTGSRIIQTLHERMVRHRRRSPDDPLIWMAANI
jgi:hypothetical protein